MGNFRLVDWARDQKTGCTGADNLLWRLGGLCNRTGRCTMTDKGIGKRFGLGERTVTRYLSHLRKKGRIKVHFEFGRRVITFIVTAASQNGLAPAPDRPKGARQIGGQNPVKGIQEMDRAEYLRIANSTNNAEKFRALAMLGQLHVARSL